MLDLDPIRRRQLDAAGGYEAGVVPLHSSDRRDNGQIYDEDGYCAACGNGHWKAHMPDCQIADLVDDIQALIDEIERLRRIAEQRTIGCDGEVEIVTLSVPKPQALAVGWLLAHGGDTSKDLRGFVQVLKAVDCWPEE